MIISSIGKQYVVLTSELITHFAQNIGDYSKLKVSGKINCGACDNPEEAELEYPTADRFIANLDVPVKLSETITKLILYNTSTGIYSNAIVTPINLSSIVDNCNSNNCTLQTEAANFTSFKTQIDAWFLTQGITSNVSVSFEDNFIIVSGIPAPYIFTSIEYGAEEISLPAFYGNEDNNVILVGDKILVAAPYFGIEEYVDGIYTFSVRIEKDTPTLSWTIESNCFFFDVTFKCKVASTLNKLKEELADSNTERVATTIHIMHYALVNGSNCGCNCSDLCNVFIELYALLTDTIGDNYNNQTSNCGC